MSRTQYQIAVESGQLGADIHLVKPRINEEYFVIPKEEALKKLAGWRDITTTTNEYKYRNAKKINAQKLAEVYAVSYTHLRAHET